MVKKLVISFSMTLSSFFFLLLYDKEGWDFPLQTSELIKKKLNQLFKRYVHGNYPFDSI